MPQYAYEALDASGKVVSGTIDAEDADKAHETLTLTGLTPIEIEEAKKKKNSPASLFKRGVSPFELSLFSRQLHTLIRAGVPTGQAISALVEQASNPHLKQALEQIRTDIFAGENLYVAFSKHPHIFSEMYVNLVRAGEESGALESTLLRLANYLEKSAKLRGKLKSAFINPALILIAALGVVYGMVAYVVPQFVSILDQFDMPLPFLTKVLMIVGNALQQHGLLILGALVGFIVAFMFYMRTPNGKMVTARTILNLPLVGTLYQKQALVNFAATLATLYSAGVHLSRSLEIIKKVIGNPLYETALESVYQDIQSGRSLSDALAQHQKLFPPLFISIMRTGEGSGSLDELLEEYVSFTEDEIDQGSQGLTQALQPIITVFLAVVVVIIMLAVLLPYFDVIKGIQKMGR